MSWMGEIAIIINEAAREGVTLELSDFRVTEGTLTIDGMPADQWYEAVVGVVLEGSCQYCNALPKNLEHHLQFCEPMR